MINPREHPQDNFPYIAQEREKLKRFLDAQEEQRAIDRALRLGRASVGGVEITYVDKGEVQ